MPNRPGAGVTLRLGNWAIEIRYTISRLTGRVQLSPWEKRDRIAVLNRRIEEENRHKDDWWW